MNFERIMLAYFIVSNFIKWLIIWNYQHEKPKCPNSYNCGDCIHAQGVWEGVTFRGIRCLKGCK